jgi:hypothetical protein
MNENRYSSHKWSDERVAHCNSDDKSQYLLSSEEQLLQSISARAPLPELLNGICSALDCQIGNVVSNISLPNEDVSELAAIAADAASFGLYVFYSAGIAAENGKFLGSLEMYCCPHRGPSPGESQLIERAACLAAIAIQRHNEADDPDDCRVPGNRLSRKAELDPPISLN